MRQALKNKKAHSIDLTIILGGKDEKEADGKVLGSDLAPDKHMGEETKKEAMMEGEPMEMEEKEKLMGDSPQEDDLETLFGKGHKDSHMVAGSLKSKVRQHLMKMGK